MEKKLTCDYCGKTEIVDPKKWIHCTIAKEYIHCSLVCHNTNLFGYAFYERTNPRIHHLPQLRDQRGAAMHDDGYDIEDEI